MPPTRKDQASPRRPGRKPRRLLPHHLKDLQKSGLSRDTIAVARIHSATADEVEELLGFAAGPGMVIPYLHVPGFGRVKPDTPFKGRDGRVAKYLSPKGSGNHLYIPPNLDEAVLADPTKTLLIVEGEKKALKCVQEGFAAVAVAGVWAWRTSDEGDQEVTAP